MSHPARYLRIIACAAGITLVVVGLIRIAGSDGTPLDLLVNVCLLAVGVTIVVAALESALRGHHEPEGKEEIRKPSDRIAGALLTLLLTVGLVGGGLLWMRHAPTRVSPSSTGSRAYPRAALARLQQIAAAQERYIERDWNGDGRMSYAQFLVHLWRSVRTDGVPVDVDLISRRLGFAMERSYAWDGYYYWFYSAHETAAAGSNPIDPEQAWAAAAVPADLGDAGGLVFVTDQEDVIYARRLQAFDAAAYPHDPAGRGWIPVTSAADLAAFE